MEIGIENVMLRNFGNVRNLKARSAKIKHYLKLINCYLLLKTIFSLFLMKQFFKHIFLQLVK